MEKKTLLISSRNIQGHTSKGHDKFSDPEFIAHVKDSDIICPWKPTVIPKNA